MAAAFGATSMTQDVLQSIDLRGKRVLVTGVSAGIGVETARALAGYGAEVIGTQPLKKHERQPGRPVQGQFQGEALN